MTLTVFDAVELVGHLPYYGFLAVMLIWTPLHDDRKLWVQGLRGELPNP